MVPLSFLVGGGWWCVSRMVFVCSGEFWYEGVSCSSLLVDCMSASMDALRVVDMVFGRLEGS